MEEKEWMDWGGKGKDCYELMYTRIEGIKGKGLQMSCSGGNFWF